mmetsp:Transcript_40212/g.110558  ORF Transcript_40212/g.110558 Transcript_40212/m.110558 type:complete len:255 (+) Transcript_40212:1235-1999(+)
MRSMKAAGCHIEPRFTSRSEDLCDIPPFLFCCASSSSAADTRSAHWRIKTSMVSAALGRLESSARPQPMGTSTPVASTKPPNFGSSRHMKALTEICTPKSLSSTRGSISATQGSGCSALSTRVVSIALANVRVGTACPKCWPRHHCNASLRSCVKGTPSPGTAPPSPAPSGPRLPWAEALSPPCSTPIVGGPSDKRWSSYKSNFWQSTSISQAGMGKTSTFTRPRRYEASKESISIVAHSCTSEAIRSWAPCDV